MTTGTMDFMTSSGLITPMAAMPTPDLAVPYAAPIEEKTSAAAAPINPKNGAVASPVSVIFSTSCRVARVASFVPRFVSHGSLSRPSARPV